MRIVNETRDRLLAERAEIATKAFERMKGLLGRDGLGRGAALVIEPCTSIHTLFMRFPISVLFVDEEGFVLAAHDRMVPWRLSRFHGRARCVVELPAGTLSSTGTEVGDRLLFVHEP